MACQKMSQEELAERVNVAREAPLFFKTFSIFIFFLKYTLRGFIIEI